MKKADWPIEYCNQCMHLRFTPINDAFCGKNGKYLWLIGSRRVDGKDWDEDKGTYNYMPKWCPLGNYEEL